MGSRLGPFCKGSRHLMLPRSAKSLLTLHLQILPNLSNGLKDELQAEMMSSLTLQPGSDGSDSTGDQFDDLLIVHIHCTYHGIVLLLLLFLQKQHIHVSTYTKSIQVPNTSC